MFKIKALHTIGRGCQFRFDPTALGLFEVVAACDAYTGTMRYREVGSKDTFSGQFNPTLAVYPMERPSAGQGMARAGVQGMVKNLRDLTWISRRFSGPGDRSGRNALDSPVSNQDGKPGS